MEKSNSMTETTQIWEKIFLGYRSVLEILLWENVLHYHRKKETQDFLIFVCLHNSKDDETNI